MDLHPDSGLRRRRELWAQSSNISNMAMMIVTNAGRASNARTCLRGMVLCTPRVSPSVKRPRGLTCPAYHDRLDACPAVVACFQSVPGLAGLPRLVIALHVVCVEIGAWGIRLVCLLVQLTGLNRFVGAS